MPRSGQRGRRGGYKPPFHTIRSVEQTLNTKILFIVNLSDVSPVKPPGLHATQSFGLYDQIEDIRVEDVYDQVDNDAANYPKQFVQFINDSLAAQTMSPLKKITDGMSAHVDGSDLLQSTLNKLKSTRPTPDPCDGIGNEVSLWSQKRQQ